MSKPKILYKIKSLKGGSPLSSLEYIKNLQDFVIDVATRINNETLKNEYELFVNKIIDIKALNEVNFIGKITSLFAGLKLIKKNNYNLMIISTSLDIFFYSYIAKLYNLPMLLIVAGGSILNQSHFVNKWIASNIICYSYENYLDLIKLGFNKNNLYLISNRISTKLAHKDNLKFYKEEFDSFVFSIISRVDNGKIKSILTIIELTKNLIDRGFKIILNIAGDGPLMEYLKKFIIDNNLDTHLQINILGHVDSPFTLINNSHLVFGKGRSVLEAILNFRIGIIVSESNTFKVCDFESINDLYINNFSGRNITKPDEPEKITYILHSIEKKLISEKELIKVQLKVSELYSSELLGVKINPIVKKLLENKYKRKSHRFVKIKIIMRVINYYKAHYLAILLRRINKIVGK